MSSQLAKWKSNSLNKAGKLVLLNSSLDNIPTYWLSLFKIPSSVCQNIEKIRRDFFWGTVNSKGKISKKMHHISWKKIILRKEHGGLGISDVHSRNTVLLSKWIPRCVATSDELGGKLRHSDFKWSLGNGTQILIWFDIWKPFSPLNKLFPRLFAISLWNYSSLRNYIELCKEHGLFSTVLWKRSLREWEKGEVSKLWEFFSTEQLKNIPDQLVWTHSGKPFSVKDYYNTLEDNLDSPSGVPVMKNLWSIYFGSAKLPLGLGSLLTSGGEFIFQKSLSGILSRCSRVLISKLLGERSLLQLFGPSDFLETFLFSKGKESQRMKWSSQFCIVLKVGVRL
ncbi:hypothetical protein POM88_046754 [Heracleum sosnowskyi]|uniref:Reverse transcriptase zinc-binding domain-containing protein n=1 Tax=Heracleum sosnowskyi TaxID=360622 RepID=A0AAD8M4Z0_9APIA|nr:hypothetical protein POM88_046754 [Heracleum sosnowskyi]